MTTFDACDPSVTDSVGPRGHVDSLGVGGIRAVDVGCNLKEVNRVGRNSRAIVYIDIVYINI
jgi:hypothetical protein